VDAHGDASDRRRFDQPGSVVVDVAAQATARELAVDLEKWNAGEERDAGRGANALRPA
jgi:hypothetical protein